MKPRRLSSQALGLSRSAAEKQGLNNSAGETEADSEGVSGPAHRPSQHLHRCEHGHASLQRRRSGARTSGHCQRASWTGTPGPLWRGGGQTLPYRAVLRRLEPPLSTQARQGCFMQTPRPTAARGWKLEQTTQQPHRVCSGSNATPGCRD